MSMAAWSEGTHIPSHRAHVVLLRPATASDRRQGRPCRPSRMARASRSQDADHHIRCIGEDEIKRSVTQQDEADFQASKLKVRKGVEVGQGALSIPAPGGGLDMSVSEQLFERGAIRIGVRTCLHEIG